MRFLGAAKPPTKPVIAIEPTLLDRPKLSPQQRLLSRPKKIVDVAPSVSQNQPRHLGRQQLFS
jgi:hypothetical protein